MVMRCRSILLVVRRPGVVRMCRVRCVRGVRVVRVRVQVRGGGGGLVLAVPERGGEIAG